ncbi:DNA topoisomerase 2 [Massospora cicadina]|nr:DNA topoisomerase 2 [Massospora cicadina]
MTPRSPLLKKISNFVPGFFKIFDEVLVNAADNKVNSGPHHKQNQGYHQPKAKSDLGYNNGNGIPVEIHKEKKVYIPELIFGHLLTSSNYDDSEKKVVGGHNGYGAKLFDIFSTEFIVEMASKASGKKYFQKFTNNMSVIRPPKITELGKEEEFMRITF